MILTMFVVFTTIIIKHMKKIMLFLLLLCVSTFTFAQSNWEVWTTFNASGNLSDKFKLILEGEDRYSHKTNDIKYFHYDMGLVYKLSSKSSAGLFYREIYGTKDHISIRLPQPHVDFFYKKPIGFKLRTRLEYQMFHSTNIDLENQFRLRIRPAWQFGFWKNYNPYIMSEIFLSQKKTLTRNRFTTGITMKFGKIVIQPNYTLEHNNKDIWTNRNVFWVNTKFKF